jgi:V-type H+-transporting ATPase subunit C
LSDQLPKIDSSFTAVVSKLLDTIHSLVDDQSKVAQYARVNAIAAEDYLITGDSRGWTWDAGRWGSGGKIGEVVDALQKASPPLFPHLSA